MHLVPRNSTTTDHELALAALDGDVASFETLYRRHAPDAWDLASAVTGNDEAATDAVAGAFGLLFDALRSGTVSAADDLGTLLLVATSARLADHDDAPAHDAPSSTFVDAYHQLPRLWRSALWLRASGKRTGRQAARILGVTHQSLLPLATRARRGLITHHLRLDVERRGTPSCGSAVRRLGLRLDGAIGDDDQIALDRHLRLCTVCQDRKAVLGGLRGELRALPNAVPTDLRSRSAAAWTTSITPVAEGTGLRPWTEKLVALAASAAAAAAVLGVAWAGGREGVASTALGPIVTQVATPAPIELPTVGTASSPSEPVSIAAIDRATPSTGTATGDDASGDDPDDTAGPTGPGTTPPTDGPGGDPGPSHPGPSDPGGPVPPLPVPDLGAGLPVAVDLGPTPGVTVGPIAIGDADPDDGLLQLGGALAPLQPVIEPVNGIVGGLLGR